MQDVVARAQTLSPGHMRCQSSADVWGDDQNFVKKPPLTCSRRRRPNGDVVARAHALPPRLTSSRPGVDVIARRRLRQPRLRLNFTRYTRPSLPFSPHFASIQSFLAWTCPPAALCKNLTDRTLAFLSYCVVVYVNRIGAPSITFIFLLQAFILPV